MKLKIASLLLFIPLCLSAKDLVDRVVAVIYHPEDRILITQSDLRPDLNGTERTLEQLILQKLMVLDAKAIKAEVTDVEVDRILSQVQTSLKMSRDEMVKYIESMGYTLDEAREQMREMQLVEQIIDYRVRSKVMVPRREIDTYCIEHPLEHEATISFSQADVSLKEYQEWEKTKKGFEQLTWEDPLTLNISGIAADKKFLTTLEKGDIAKISEQGDKVRLVMITGKTEKVIVPACERIKDVTQLLSKDRFEKRMEAYEKELKNQATIQYL